MKNTLAVESRTRRFARFLRELRENARVSVLDVAKICQISQEEVENWERGQSIPSEQTLLKLARPYRIKFQELLEVHSDCLQRLSGSL